MNAPTSAEEAIDIAKREIAKITSSLHRHAAFADKQAAAKQLFDLATAAEAAGHTQAAKLYREEGRMLQNP